MRVLDLFSGIGGGSLGFEMAGFEIAGHSEIEKFPCAVLHHHWPSVKNYGDITKFDEWPDDIEPEVIIGGSPCQSFSTAGLRKGLADPRGKLMLTYLAVIDRYRPKWVVLENVFGALSADGGRAFASLLRGLEECGYHAAWRVLDAQHVRITGFCRAVPQRRRRVFVVGYPGDWRRAAAVLFDSARCERNSEKGEKEREADSALTSSGVGTCGADENQAQAGHIVSKTITAGYGSRKDYETETMVVNARQYPVHGSVHGSIDTDGGTHAIVRNECVRRLTPLECERLQGFPDGWTDIDLNGRNASDRARYKAIGNAMPVNVMRWIAERIVLIERISNDRG